MIVEIILFLIALYLFIGVVFAIGFVLKGAQIIDESARGGTIGFRILIFPGSVIFWPILLKKWQKAKQIHN